jgi:hypothetical protein
MSEIRDCFAADQGFVNRSKVEGRSTIEIFVRRLGDNLSSVVTSSAVTSSLAVSRHSVSRQFLPRTIFGQPQSVAGNVAFVQVM